jgi:hypothetical protein
MSTTRGSETRQKSVAVLVRLEPRVADDVRAAAAARNISGASWVRTLIEGELAHERSMPRRGPPDFATQSRLAEVATALGRQTGALIQFAKSVRVSGVTPGLHADAERTLQEARQALGLVLAALERRRR